MKHKVIYTDFEEKVEEYETNTLVNIHFFFSDYLYCHNEINTYKAYRLDSNQEVCLDGFKHKLPIIGEESISFKMPDFDIQIKAYKIKNDNLASIFVDTSNIKNILYIKDSNNKSYITQALFSDYYDLGFEDCDFDDLRFTKFILGMNFKVVLNIVKDLNVVLLFNDKKYKVSKKNTLNFNNIKIHEYIFTDIDFLKEGTIKFQLE